MSVQHVTINPGNNKIYSKNIINVLGVLLNPKLLWSQHASNTIIKANRHLNAIKLIRRFFNTKELTQLITSNFYSILYYNIEMWHIRSLKLNLKQ